MAEIIQSIIKSIDEFFSKALLMFINDNYLVLLLRGLLNTSIISAGAAIVGLILGSLVAMAKLTKSKNPFLVALKWICNAYVIIIRGTPMALQLFIMAYVIFTIRGFPQMLTAILAFGINSGAYVAENIRAGILSVDIGQTEAGRSLGLSGKTTMMCIVMPQAIKNVIPSVGNELIALIKETSIVSMIGLIDLTNAAKLIGSGQNLASYIIPMSVVALFYLAIVYLLTFIIKLIEGGLRKSDKR